MTIEWPFQWQYRWLRMKLHKLRRNEEIRFRLWYWWHGVQYHYKPEGYFKLPIQITLLFLVASYASYRYQVKPVRELLNDKNIQILSSPSISPSNFGRIVRPNDYLPQAWNIDKSSERIFAIGCSDLIHTVNCFHQIQLHIPRESRLLDLFLGVDWQPLDGKDAIEHMALHHSEHSRNYYFEYQKRLLSTFRTWQYTMIAWSVLSGIAKSVHNNVVKKSILNAVLRTISKILYFH